MAEYIDRDLAIEFLPVAYDSAINALRNVPAADVAPVVYCRHCRSYNKPRLGWCSVHLDCEGPDDFCGYGARMDGNESEAR